MNIDESKMESLWLENEKGEVSYDVVDPPEGFIYQHSKFPCTLNHNVLRAIVPKEVGSCDHPIEDIRKTYGWIDGIEGRRCARCGGTQTKKTTEDWPENWDASGSVSLISGSSSYPKNLVLALTRPTLKERLISLGRGFVRLKTYDLDKAIRIAADSCERCLNVLLYKYGQNDGYKEFSDEWHRCGTECQFCEHLGRGKYWENK
jgi:hypothetical protein